MTKLHIGTSGFSFKAWQGDALFYPPGLAQKKWLSFYADHLAAVEINNTFYRLPRAEQVSSWNEQVQSSFRFVFKASRRITHFGRLRRVDEPLQYLLGALRILGNQLGAVLFQLPPNLTCDLGLLEDFVGRLPAGLRFAFEFRHESWFDPAIYRCLERGNHALVWVDGSSARTTALTRTASWGYVRLRAETYDDADLDRWQGVISSEKWDEAFVFFKHDEDAIAPRLALKLAQRVAMSAGHKADV